jgi:hypothetical protein
MTVCTSVNHMTGLCMLRMWHRHRLQDCKATELGASCKCAASLLIHSVSCAASCLTSTVDKSSKVVIVV